MEYRNENKYLCTEREFSIIFHRLSCIMKKDENITIENGYNIRSIYFDNYSSDFFFQNDAGLNERIKVRIRIYNKNKDVIKLEIKSKKNGLINKVGCKISENIFMKILNGSISMSDCDNNILKKVYILIKTQYLKPKIIVEYERYVFINKNGNVRITFDRNIRASKKIERFFEDNIYAIPLQELNHHLLEVKYDEFLPDYISNALELNNLELTTFSKYYLSIMNCFM